MRQKIGVAVIAVSALYSAADLLGWLRPMLLRMRVHDGPKRTVAIVLGALTFKAVILIAGAALVFWPGRSRQSNVRR